jgi:hypothetical protein
MKRFLSLAALCVALLLLVSVAPAGAQLIYTAPDSTGLFAGVNAGNTSLTNDYNTGIGYNSLSGLTSGFWNTGVGASSLSAVTSGVSNTGVGLSVLASTTNGSRNTAMGYQALYTASTSSNNVAVGYNSLYTMNVGGDSYNTAVGYSAFFSQQNGTGDTALGANAGESMEGGTNNTFLGYNSGPTSNGLTNATAVGYNAQVATDNSLVLGGTGDDAVKVGIGTDSPTKPLDVNGNTIRVRQDRTPSSSSESCQKGEIAWDGSYIYVCVAANTWRRSALSSF